MTTIYYVVNGSIANKETMDLSKYSKDLLTVMFSMQLERFGKVRPDPQTLPIYGHDGTPIEVFPIEKTTIYIFLVQNTSVAVALALIEEERYVPPPIMTSMDICPYFKHTLVEIREGHAETEYYIKLIQAEVQIVVDLLKILTGQEEEEEGPRPYSENPVIREAVIKLKPMSRLDNPLYRTFSVLNELRGYLRSATGPNPIKRQFLSVIHYRGMPWMIISTTVITDVSFEQQRIVRFPSAWIYGVEHSDNTEMRNMSLLLHSITSYAMNQLFPRLRLLEIPSPYPVMAEILKAASKKYGFIIDPPGYRINIEREKNWMNIWKQWIRPCDACCYEPAKWKCDATLLCENCA